MTAGKRLEGVNLLCANLDLIFADTAACEQESYLHFFAGQLVVRSGGPNGLGRRKY